MSPQKVPVAGVTNLDLSVDGEAANDVTLDQFVQAKHFALEKDAGRSTYQSNLDASSKMLYSKIQIVPGPTKKSKQQYVANAVTEHSKERDGAAVSQSRRAAEVEPSLGGRLQLSKNQTKVGIKKNLQSLNNTNANLNSSGMLNDKKMQNQLNSAVLGKQAGAVPKGPLPSQHNA